MKLTRRIAIILVGLVVVVLGCSAALSTARERASFADDTTRDEVVVGRALAAAIERELANGEDEADARAMLEAASDRERGMKFRWTTREDEPAGLSAEEWGTLVAGGTVTQRSESSEVQRTWAPAHRANGEIGAVVVEDSLEDEAAYLRGSVLRTLAVALLLSIATALVIVWVGVTFVGRPIRALVAHARKVGAGDFKARSDIAQNDEIGVLAIEMNEMTDELARSRAALANETDRRLRTLEQLRHADRLGTVGTLASGLAHELGTPLNVVQGHAGLILERKELGRDVLNGAKVIADQTVKMTRLVRQLLDFARRKGPTKEDTDLCDIAKKVVSVLEAYAKQYGGTVEIVAPESVRIAIDASTIQQVVMNLVVNAIQATPAHGAPVKVEIVPAREIEPPLGEGRGPGPYVALRVVDSGSGIAPDDLAHIFEPFFTTKEVGEGTGLGLSVSYGIVQDHGGWITATSRAGEPTVFEVNLPAFRPAGSLRPSAPRDAERPAPLSAEASV